VYEEFGQELSERRYNYNGFLKGFADDTDNKAYEDLEEPLGDEAFKARLTLKSGRLYPKTRGRVRGVGIVL
jgi:hypothetical protein